MNSLVSFNLCTLSDEELAKKVDEMTDKMYQTREIPSRHIPARPNEDYDLLVGELCKRVLNTSHRPSNYIDISLSLGDDVFTKIDGVPHKCKIVHIDPEHVILQPHAPLMNRIKIHKSLIKKPLAQKTT